MPKFRVMVTEMVRQRADVIVEAPSREYLESHLSEVYSGACDRPDVEWEVEGDGGGEEASHIVLGEVDDPKEPDMTLEATLPGDPCEREQ